ncbi:hypothetical protein KDAU_32100 [Dictyobacter aurantiacus]|uniref:Uncharacterized protein n=1 Tax=Dictyobacter aurantiacus TaxID=1936993 RepID=A0A401ZG75_9CHLR|nr:hypothetical protein KDAU_32100 [Dictyobacter aurantiacus]
MLFGTVHRGRIRAPDVPSQQNKRGRAADARAAALKHANEKSVIHSLYTLKVKNEVKEKRRIP